MKILLVDDDSFLRDMYATKFTECGHIVETVGDSKQALGKIKETEYDLVLLDMIMPGMTGIELLKEVVASNNKRNTKFVMLTNQSEASDKIEAEAAGADGYIVKAESIPSEVVKKVEEFFKQK